MGYLIILMAAILNLIIINADNPLEFIQSLFALLFMAFFIVYTAASFVMIHKNELKIKENLQNKEIMEKFGTFWEGIDLKKPFAVYFKALE